MTVEAITAAALALPPETRAELAETLLHSLDETTAAKYWNEWESEIEQRIAAFDRGDMKTYSQEELERFLEADDPQ
jgi:putative addiction module component (TIGR02574 family)